MAGPTRIHPLQIAAVSLGNGNLEEELLSVQRQLEILNEFGNVDVVYTRENGNVTKETIEDLQGNVLRESTFTYHPNGTVNTITVTYGDKTVVRTLVYNATTGDVDKIQIRTP